MFGADQGADNDPVTIPQGGGYVWFEVQGITAARDRSLEDVKAEIEKTRAEARRRHGWIMDTYLLRRRS